MVERLKSTDGMSVTYSTLTLLFVFVLKLEFVISTDHQAIIHRTNNNLSCYVCVEQLVGYADYTDSCRFFNASSSNALSYKTDCSTNNPDNNYTGEYECRKLVISYRSVDIYLRRDCVPKGLCSWKDKSQSMMNTPVSDCVYTDSSEQELQCIYCCDTPLCNRTSSYYKTNQIILWLLLMFSWWKRNHQ